MLIPLVVLAALAAIAGALQITSFGLHWNFLERWLEPVIEVGEHHLSGGAVDAKYFLMALAIASAAIGISVSVAVYNKHKLKAIEPTILANGWYYDKAVSAFMGGPGEQAFEDVAWFDANVVDGAVKGTAAVVQSSGGILRRVQGGFVRVYAALIGIGVVLVLAWFFYRGVA
jgi:NADH-quinone oxidoreductase subunit L